MSNPIAVYDLTISLRVYDEDTHNLEWYIKQFNVLAKKWVFQQEEGGEDGYPHLQCRISLHKKKRGSELKKLLQSIGGPFAGAHYSATSTNGVEEGDFYCMKLDTRVAGPWTNKDEDIQDLVNPPYIPRQVRETPNLYKWQKDVIASKEVWCTRSINCLINRGGGIGKSTLIAHCRAYKHARVLPPVNDNKDLLRMVCDMPTNKMYMFDMPRAMKKEKLFQFFQAIETLKDGYAYDDRYEFREKAFDCPQIWIFTNQKPDVSLLTEDRWKFWDVNDKAELIEKKEDDPFTPVGDLEEDNAGVETLDIKVKDDLPTRITNVSRRLNEQAVEMKFLRKKLADKELI